MAVLLMKRRDRVHHHDDNTNNDHCQKGEIKRLASRCRSAEYDAFELLLARTLVSYAQGFDSDN